MSAHTAGPWVRGSNGEPTAVLSSVTWEQVGQVNDALAGWQANASLIAAAPMLRDSVKQLLEYAEMYLGLCDDQNEAAELAIINGAAALLIAAGETE